MKKNIYFIFSKTNTKLGIMIRFLTKHKYNHVSISLNETLQPMYSFARFRERKPFKGGFVEESWLRYLYNEKDIMVQIICVPIEEDCYRRIWERIERMKTCSTQFTYDFTGLLLNRRNNQKYTCISFATDILKEATGNPRLNFKGIRGMQKFLEGYLLEEKIIKNGEKTDFSWGNDKYYEKKERKEDA